MTTLNQVKVVNRKIEGKDFSVDASKLNPAHIPVDQTAFSSLPPGTAVNLEQLLQMLINNCLLYTSPSPRDLSTSRMPSSA